MRLQEKVGQDLLAAMKGKNTARISALRVLIGEFQRQAKKELDDAAVLGIIRKLVKAEQEVLVHTGAASSDYLEVLDSYLPRLADEKEISDWIAAHVDFSMFASRMQAMKPIMAHFGSRADGSVVRRILEKG